MDNFFSQQSLINASQDSIFYEPSGRSIIAEAIKDNKSITKPTAFLSHSHKDRKLAIGIAKMFQAYGIHIYIDWMDDEMPARTSEQTASKIKNKIKACHLFLFLATQNSKESRWCPWEIGFADRDKKPHRVIVIPTRDSWGNNHGNEYLNLYPHISSDKLIHSHKRVTIFQDGSSMYRKPTIESLLVMPD